ncbi:hypothetical protein BDR04DRAFT_1102289 [Suillus decipiens]|nr:hypothetical protein BDR04DRAFT_1102289 [Suillus decipiens]
MKSITWCNVLRIFCVFALVSLHFVKIGPSLLTGSSLENNRGPSSGKRNSLQSTTEHSVAQSDPLMLET